MSRVYSYKAAKGQGEIIRGEIIAANPHDIYQQLRDQGYFLISGRLKNEYWKRKVPAQELLDFCLHMQYMDQAGVPLLDALLDAQTSSSKLKPILADIIIQIKGGKMLSEAISMHRETFPEIFQPILYLSEQSGHLSQGFKTLYEHLSWTEETKRQIIKQLQYPGIVFALICGVIWMMSAVVIPQMMDLVKISGVQLPYASSLLLELNQSFVAWAPWVLVFFVFLVLSVFGLRFLSSSQRKLQDRVILKIPVIGGLLLRREIAMYLHFFHVCLAAHVDLLECMAHGRRAVRNTWLREKLTVCTKRVQEGSTLSKAMAESGIFNASTLRMMQIGEVTGQLIALLSVVESYQVRDLKRQIERFLAFLQPVLLGVIGMMLIWIVLGIFYPLYDQLLVIEG